MIIILNKKTINFIILALIIIFLFIFKFAFFEKAVPTSTTPSGYIALVIDDFGNNGEGIDELTKLNIPITAAVMPFLEYTEIDAKKAYDTNMEIILHLPMEPEKGDPKWLGPRAIRSNLCDYEIREIINDALDQLQWAKGINNHMGSKIMKDKIIMKEILNVVKERNLYFLNSRTDETNVAADLSKELEVVYFQRDVFLDNERNEYSITKAMNQLGKIALEKGYAIGIGHVGGQGGKITVDTIEKMSKKLEEEGIKFIYLSQIEELFLRKSK